jgi:hypothetical protein
MAGPFLLRDAQRGVTEDTDTFPEGNVTVAPQTSNTLAIARSAGVSGKGICSGRLW